jgi:hypothetical protein
MTGAERNLGNGRDEHINRLRSIFHREPSERQRGRFGRRAGSIGVVAALGLGAVGGVTACQPDSGGGSGNVVGIEVAGTKVPTDFVGPIVQAGEVCSAITPQILAALTYVESTFNDMDSNSQVKSSAGAEGPTQWMPQYWPSGAGNIWDISDAEMATARRLCGADANNGGDVTSAVQSYNPNDPGYGANIVDLASQTTLEYGSNNSGGSKKKSSQHINGSSNGSQQQKAPKPHDLNSCWQGVSGDTTCRIGSTDWYYDKTTHQVSH